MRRQYEKGRTNEILEHYPANGVPTSVTLQAVDADGEDLIAEEAVTPDSFSQTVTGVTKRDKVLTVPDGTGAVVGRHYWLSTDGGRGYAVRLLEVDGNNLLMAIPAKFDIASGTIKGLRLARVLTETSEVKRGVTLIWRYTVNSLPVTIRESIDIVETPWWVDVTDGDMQTASPQFGEQVGTYDGFGDLKENVRRQLWGEIVASGANPDELGSREILREAMAFGVLLEWVGDQAELGRDDQNVIHWETRFAAAWDRYWRAELYQRQFEEAS